MKILQTRAVYSVQLVALLGLSAMSVATNTSAQEVIVDNQDPNTSQSGTWSTSSAPSPYLGNSVYSNSNGLFTWHPDLPQDGDYDVYAWWTYHPNRSVAVPYVIDLDGPSLPVIVNQRIQSLGGQWNPLGRFSYSGSGAPSISVSSENGQANADAVRLVLVPPREPAAEWPEVSCPCDVYFSRAVDKYLAFGGNMIPHHYDDVVTHYPSRGGCSDDGTSAEAGYVTETLLAPPSDPADAFLRLRLFAGPNGCSVLTHGTFNPDWTFATEGQPKPIIYERQVENLNSVEAAACRASVRDFCKDDLYPPEPPL